MGNNLISRIPWGKYQGKEIFLFRITDRKGAYVELTNYGASVVSVVVPDKHDSFGNVVLGFPMLQGYLDDECYLGSTVGRYANRIANGKFRLNGVDYQIETNDGLHSNHSGSSGFNAKVFEEEIKENEISFSFLSEDGDGGFPGNLRVVVSYSWIDMELRIKYTAETDQNTIVNITNHSYFNLTAGQENIFRHELTIHANEYLPMNADYIPTGEILNDEAMIFSKTSIGSKLQTGHVFKGLNTCYALKQADKSARDPVAELYDPVSGRSLEVFTSYPGLLCYTGDYLSSTTPGHYSAAYKPFEGLCLECQYFPDSPNHLNFPSSVLEAGKLYHESISYKFNVEPHLIIPPNSGNLILKNK